MAKPQLEDGYTAIANEILEQLIKRHLPPNLWQVLMFIIRKTYGYHKKDDYITNSQIVDGTGIHKTHVSRAMGLLLKMEMITRSGKIIGFQKDWERWKELPEQVTKVTKIGNNNTDEKLPDTQPKLPDTQPKLPEQVTKVTSPRITQKIKDTFTKTTIQKQYTIPEWIDQETWDAFLEVRKRKKAVDTDHALGLVVKELERLRAAGDNPRDVLDKSIRNSWKDVFPLNNGGNGHGRISGQMAPRNEKPTGVTIIE